MGQSGAAVGSLPSHCPWRCRITQLLFSRASAHHKRLCTEWREVASLQRDANHILVGRRSSCPLPTMDVIANNKTASTFCFTGPLWPTLLAPADKRTGLSCDLHPVAEDRRAQS